jgi:hypothetical protein
MEQIEEKFLKLRLEDAMKIQERMMFLLDYIKFDQEYNFEEDSENIEDEEDFFEEDGNPAKNELFILMQVYRTILSHQ